MKFKFLLFMVCFFSSLNTSAARSWEITNNYIQEVKVYNKPINGTNFNVVTFVFRNPITSSCVLSNTERSVSYWIDAAIPDTVSVWVSVALAAQAQNRPVNVYTENSVCSSNFGRELRGISFSAD